MKEPNPVEVQRFITEGIQRVIAEANARYGVEIKATSSTELPERWKRAIASAPPELRADATVRAVRALDSNKSHNTPTESIAADIARAHDLMHDFLESWATAGVNIIALTPASSTTKDELKSFINSYTTLTARLEAISMLVCHFHATLKRIGVPGSPHFTPDHLTPIQPAGEA